MMLFSGAGGAFVIESAAAASLLFPFVFFPATAALFASVRDMVLDTSSRKLVRSFMGYMRENYRKSMIGGIFITAAWLCWAAGYFSFSSVSVIFQFAMLGAGIPLLIVTLYFFVVNAHYDIAVKEIYKKALLLTFGNVRLSLMILGVTFLLFYVSINGFLALLLFFTAAITAFIIFSLFYRFYVSVNTQNV